MRDEQRLQEFLKSMDQPVECVKVESPSGSRAETLEIQKTGVARHLQALVPQLISVIREPASLEVSKHSAVLPERHGIGHPVPDFNFEGIRTAAVVPHFGRPLPIKKIKVDARETA